jgi:hypothetical protein
MLVLVLRSLICRENAAGLLPSVTAPFLIMVRVLKRVQGCFPASMSYPQSRWYRCRQIDLGGSHANWYKEGVRTNAGWILGILGPSPGGRSLSWKAMFLENPSEWCQLEGSIHVVGKKLRGLSKTLLELRLAIPLAFGWGY